MPFLRHFAAAAAVQLLAFLLLGIYLEPLSGDLTRLGSLSERSWGWNRDQPPMLVLGNNPREDVSVLVIGDSFSAQNRWQSVASAATGLAFVTYQWPDIGDPACLPDAIRILKRRHPHARTIVVESVERLYMQRFDAARRPTDCKAEIATTNFTRGGNWPTRRDLLADVMPDPVYGVKALWADIHPESGLHASGVTFIAPLSRSDLFSNRKSDQLLFYRDDKTKYAWRPDQVERPIGNAKMLSEAGSTIDLKVILAVVPDKLTVYSRFLQSGSAAPAPFDLWRALKAAGIASVDLDERLTRAASSNVDLYLPDDTHLGSRGYMEMGHVIAEEILSHQSR